MQPPNKTAQPEPKAPVPPRMGAARSAWAWPVAWMVVALLLVGGAVYVFKSCRDLPGDTLDKAGKLAQKLGEKLESVAGAFRQGTVTTTFMSYAATVSGSQYFQFASLNQHEIFTQTNQSSLAYGYVPLPDVIVEARAPVTYTYYLDLNDRWDFVLQDGVVLVTAPDIKFNKPAVDVSRMTWEVRKDSYFRNTTAAMEELKRSITWHSYKNAQANIGLVRETGRRQTELFVQNWLAKAFADGKNYPVKVRFRKEAQEPNGGTLGTGQERPAR